MCSYLRVNLIQYECTCKYLYPLCHLYFCRKCNRIRCPLCLNEEIDILFCPHCLENNSLTDSKYVGGKYFCSNCYQCPLCENVLVEKTHGDLQCFLQCNACFWTTKDSNLKDQEKSSQWPEHSNSIENHLNEVLKHMKALGNLEKLEKSRQNQINKRRSNMGVLINDRYGLNKSYAARHLALQKTVPILPSVINIKPSADVEELDPSIFTEEVDATKVLTMEQLLKQPLAAKKSDKQKLLPIKVKLISRRGMRCHECETILYKSEYNPNTCFAIEYLPDVKFSRRVDLVPGSPAFYLILTNNYPAKMVLTCNGLKPDSTFDDNENFVDCSEWSLQVTIPCRDETADIDEYVKGCNTDEKFMFVRRNRVAMVVDCCCSEEKVKNLSLNSYTLLNLKFYYNNDENEIINEKFWKAATIETRLKLFIGEASEK